MKSYEETTKTVQQSITNGSFSFPRRKTLDYTGVGFGYNLKQSYPKTWDEAERDAAAPDFASLVGEVD